MSAEPDLNHEELISRIRRDLADSWDEELEMDVEDYHPLPGLPDGGAMVRAKRTIAATTSSNCSACRASS